MLNSRRLRQVFFIGTFSVLTAMFQNCAKHPGGLQATSAAGITGGVQVVGTASSYNKIDVLSQNGSSFSIDLANHSVVSSSGSCNVDTSKDSRIAQLSSLLQQASVCKPAEVAADQAVCMAIAVSDIKLSDSSSTLELAKEVCHTGTFLCDGMDDILRAKLADLQANPPACL